VGIAPKALRINLDFMNAAGSSVLGRLNPVSKPFDQVSHVAFAIWWFLRGAAASPSARGENNRKCARVP
jgi:hypothetical protein